MNTMTKEEAIKLNIKVWARRMGVTFNKGTLRGSFFLLLFLLGGGFYRPH